MQTNKKILIFFGQCSSVWKRLYFLWLYDNFFIFKYLYADIYGVAWCLILFSIFSAHEMCIEAYCVSTEPLYLIFMVIICRNLTYSHMYICRRLYDENERKSELEWVREKHSHCLFRTRRLQNKILIFFGNYILFNLRLAIYICLYKYFILFFIIIIIIHFILYFFRVDYNSVEFKFLLIYVQIKFNKYACILLLLFLVHTIHFIKWMEQLQKSEAIKVSTCYN